MRAHPETVGKQSDAAWGRRMVEYRSSGGVPIFGVLGIVFIVLKLTGVIHWNWLWVLAPIWGPFLAAMVVILVVALTKLLVDR